ncbi:hypothetical protein D3C85_1296120 [compost metagenome]
MGDAVVDQRHRHFLGYVVQVDRAGVALVTGDLPLGVAQFRLAHAAACADVCTEAARASSTGIDFEVGVPERSPMLSSGTSGLVSG